PQARSQCVEARQRAVVAIKKRELLHVDAFIPKCDPDGRFSQIQCLKEPSVCWCVDGLGKEIVGTRGRQQIPVCPSPSPKNRSPWKQKRQNYKGCPKSVRNAFNKRVLNYLEQQFVAYMGKASSVGFMQQGSQGHHGIGEVHILMWKFNQLDMNANYFLEWRELHELLRTTKKTIYPKKCSKTFVAYCDENADNRISRNEWYACFGVKECTRDILPAFTDQLLQLFRKEVTATQIDDRAFVGQLDDTLIRIQRKARSGNLGAWGTFLSDNQVLAWKFHQLDINKNRILTSSEYFVSSMKKALGRIKRGRRCSRKLLNDCDFDKNGGLSVDEWTYCLRVGLNKFLR
ncbi:hypothetical protein QZH41_015553, partial [Actinostola sp. cb2023]